MKELKFKEGDIIIKQGAKNKDAFFIKSGRVELSIIKGKLSRPHAVLEENNVFNEMALISNEPVVYTAVAVQDTVIMVIDRKSLREYFLKSDRPIATAVMFLLEEFKAEHEGMYASVDENGIIYDNVEEDDEGGDQFASELYGDSESSDVSKADHGDSRYIVFTGLSDISKRTLVRGKLDVRRFPFRVGRRVNARSYTVESSVNTVQGVDDENKSGKVGVMDLEIDEISRPYYVSANHYYIEKDGNNFIIVDNASRLGIILNKKKVNGTAILEKENILIIGSQYSPYVYKVEIMGK
ncbi:MAG: cyclic nucleotide-binding domain-containing protein [Candidatus Anammoxibacter sp.]